MKIKIVDFVHSDFYLLAQAEFIEKKKRRGELLSHFPFLSDSNLFKNIIIENDNGKVVAGLVLKLTHLCKVKFGSVGLVVVDESERGRGYSKIILDAAIDEAKQLNLDFMLLWTSLHNVYNKAGFIVNEPLEYLQFQEKKQNISVIEKVKGDFLSRPTYTQRLGIFEYQNAEVTFVDDGQGFIFVDYSGDIKTAASIILEKYNRLTGPRVFLEKGDPLINELKQRQTDYVCFDSAYEMRLILNENNSREYNFHCKFLDRI